MRANAINVLLFLTKPISYLWVLIYRIRRFLYDVNIIKRNKFKVPVISVGNLTLGGTGKTPFTLWLGKYLNTLDRKVMVLTRGYKGKLEHSSGIIKTGKIIGHNPYDYGDEALVLCRGLDNASVVVGKKRSENLKFYFDKEQPDVVLLDDGYQHLKVDRDLNIVLFDSLLDVERYKAPPHGYLREGLTALKDADIIIFGRADIATNEQLEVLKALVSKHARENVSYASFHYTPSSIRDINYQESLELGDLSGQNVICLSGVASPKSFHELVKSLGANIIETFQFPDHHFYTEDDIGPITDLANENDALIITTEKDIVKLRRVSESQKIYYVEITISFLSGEENVINLVNKIIY